MAIWIAFLFDIATRPTKKYQNLYSKFVKLFNTNKILVVSHTSGNTIHAISLHIMMDFRTQSVIISKQLVQQLDLIAIDFDPYHIIIVTLVGSIKQATKQSL